ncbi:MAG: Omp28-related outer membrane protein [Bacteroidales bacterium]|jgi:hypothetical protein|nr:Omp28-related outer membrane protein [Bacteroidales bacterium]
MRYRIYLLFAAISLLILAIACDNFSEDEIGTPFIGETLETTPITKNESLQRVLLEDYTGWKCPNCPKAAVISANLLSQYGNVLVAMAVHTGSMSIPAAANYNLNLRTSYGEMWENMFDIEVFPSGLINRVKSNSSYAYTNPEDWEAVIAERSQREHILDINLGVKLNSDTTKIIVSTENKALADIDFPMLINVVVLESDIEGVQLNGDATYGDTPKINNYKFNHVLRTNGRIDFPLTSDKTNSGATINKNYFIDIPLKEDKTHLWNLDNCAVVVFVTNAETNEVIQVNEIEL